MLGIAFAFFFSSTIAVLFHGLLRRERLIQLPFLASAVCVGWVIPQLIGLTGDSGLPANGLAKVAFMASLCLISLYAGYYSANAQPPANADDQYSRRALEYGSGILSAIGAYFFFKTSQIAGEANELYGGQWTGIITVYAFLSRFLTFGFAISLPLFLKTKSRIALLITLFDSAFYLHRVFVQGRRAAMVELLLIIATAVYVNRKWTPPRTLMIVVLICGALLINAIGPYRAVMLSPDGFSWSGAGVEEVMSIDYVGVFRSITSQGGEELRNAVMDISASDYLGDFNLGLSQWNALVFNYIPAQFFGPEFKKSLMFDLRDSAFVAYGHVPWVGTTHTGFADAFQSFWYFGAMNYFLIGMLVGRWFRLAERGQFQSQVFVSLALTPALHAITHNTSNFFVFAFLLMILVWPVLAVSKRKAKRVLAIDGSAT